MLTHFRALWPRLRGSFWVRPALYSLNATVAVGGVLLLADNVPHLELLPRPRESAVADVLRLVTSSALTVATVSLSVIMLVLNMAGAQGSPRAVPQLLEDRVVQRALAAFIGVFVFGVAGLLALGLDRVGPPGLPLLFMLAVLAALLLLQYLVRLIHQVTDLLKLDRLIERVHERGLRALRHYLREVPEDHAAAEQSASVSGPPALLFVAEPGFVVAIDEGRLVELAESHGLVIDVVVRPGHYVSAARPALAVRGLPDEGVEPPDEAVQRLKQQLLGTVSCGRERDTATDPVLGPELLAEIACRALSPGVNDWRTALACLDRLGDLLGRAVATPPEAWPPRIRGDGRVRLERIDLAEMIEKAVEPIGHDGAHLIDVVERILASLGGVWAVAHPGHHGAIEAAARRVHARATSSLGAAAERKRLERISSRLPFGCAAAAAG